MKQKEQQVITERKENAPLHFMQRLAYTIIDFGLILMTYFGLYQLCMHTPISDNLHKAESEMVEIQIETGTSTGFFVKTYLQEGEDTNAKKYQDEGGVYYFATDDNYKSAYQESLKGNKNYSDLKFNYTVNTFAISLSCLLVSESIFLLVIPLTNKRRATLGILVAGGMMMSKKIVNRARWYQVLGRLGFVFIIDTCILYFIGSDTLLLIIPILTLIMTCLNKERRTVHDMAVGVKIIDKTTFVPLVDHDEPAEEMVEQPKKEEKPVAETLEK